MKPSCIPLNIWGNIKDHTLQGARVQPGATAIQASSLLFPFPPLLQGSCFCTARLKEKDFEQGGETGGGGGGGGGSFSSCVCVHHVSWPLLAFMFCLAESPAPAVSVSSLKICVPQRQETRSLLCIHFSSAQLSVAGLCAHLADTSSSADTSSLHGLSWLTGSCPYG